MNEFKSHKGGCSTRAAQRGRQNSRLAPIKPQLLFQVYSIALSRVSGIYENIPKLPRTGTNKKRR